VIDRIPQGGAVLDGVVVASASLVLPWSDPVAQWGLGVFETIAVSGAAPRHLDAHLSRLTAAAERLGVPLPEAADLARATSIVAAGAPGSGAGRAGCGLRSRSRSSSWYPRCRYLRSLMSVPAVPRAILRPSATPRHSNQRHGRCH